MGDSITEGSIISFEKQVGEYANVDDILVVIETDKTSIDVRATDAGIVTKHSVNIGDAVEIDQPVVEIDTAAEKPAEAAKPTKAAAATPMPAASSTPTQAAAPPAAKPAAPVQSSAPAAEARPALAIVPGSREERRVPLSRMRLKIAQRLKDSQNTAAMLSTFNEIDCSNLMKLRSKHKDAFLEKHGIKLGFMSAFVKASTLALQEQPAVNAYMDLEKKQIVYHDYVDISVAVASKKGLVVPVLRNTEQMSFADVESTIARYGAQAREDKLALEDMAGGTFTISNGGIFGGLFGTPIINPPQSAVLGMYGIFDRPIAVKGEVVIRPMMYATLTYDHRIVDGREAVLFLRKVKSCIEDPQEMLLNV